MPTSDLLIAQLLLTPEGKKKLKNAFQLGAAKAADKVPEGSLRWYVARQLAGLPLKLAKK